MSDYVDDILVLHNRVRQAGFGTLTVPPTTPLHGPIGTIQVKPIERERADLRAFLARLMGEYQLVYSRDQLELRYQNGQITLAEITFMI